MNARYTHTNIVARDWQALAAFYEHVFGCVRLAPERHLSGAWLAKGTGLPEAALDGVHLLLPGHGPEGPTLEIFQYQRNAPGLPPAANREGFRHLAFQVDDIREALERVLRHGGRAIGEPVAAHLEGRGTLIFVYAADPEGNLIELQGRRARPTP